MSIASAVTALQVALSGYDAAVRTLIGTNGFAAPVVTTGTAPAFVLTPPVPLKALAAGVRLNVNFATAGVLGNNTLNVSGLGAVNMLQYAQSGVLEPATIPAGLIQDVEYNGTNWVFVDSLPPGLISGPVFTTTYVAGPPVQLPATIGNGTVLSNSAAGGDQEKLPACSVFNPGTRVIFRNIGVGRLRLIASTAGGDNISNLTGSVPFIYIEAGDSVTLETDGVHTWGIVPGAGQQRVLQSNFCVVGAQGQAFSANTPAQVMFANTVSFDDLSEINNNTFSQFVPLRRGSYVFSAAVCGTSGSATNKYLSLYVNGVELLRMQQQVGGLAGSVISATSGPVQLNAGDVVQIWYSTSVADNLSTSPVENFFSGWRVK